MTAPSVSLPSPLRYPGGKSRVARRLCRFIPPHREYREPFVGGGAIFLRKPKAEKSWINDLHPGVYAFWKTLRDHFEDFARLCREINGRVRGPQGQPSEDALRAEFDRWIERRDLMTAQGDDHLVERAVQFYFINRTVWTGRVVYDPARRSRLYFSNPGGWSRLEKRLAHLAACSRKLQGVEITQLSFEECLGEATGETFIYADPPYYRDSLDPPTSRLYEGHFTIEHHRLLRDLLARTPARVMVSYDDCPPVCELYDGGWHVARLRWKYCGRYAKTNAQRARNEKEKKVEGRELLIMNYEPNEVLPSREKQPSLFSQETR